jgi:hypothetical protein
MDSALFGFTQTVLQCRAGRHDFDLGANKDYTPESQNVNVRETSPLTPMRIRFQPRTAAFITLAAGPEAKSPEARSRRMKAKEPGKARRGTKRKKRAAKGRKHR